MGKEVLFGFPSCLWVESLPFVSGQLHKDFQDVFGMQSPVIHAFYIQYQRMFRIITIPLVELQEHDQERNLQPSPAVKDGIEYLFEPRFGVNIVIIDF